MLWTITCFIFILLIAWYWLANMRCREFALDAAKAVCENYGWSLLDESVAMTTWRPLVRSKGLCVKRIYEFEYTRSGTERGFARITLIGHSVAPHQHTKPSNASSGDNIVHLAQRGAPKNDASHYE